MREGGKKNFLPDGGNVSDPVPQPCRVQSGSNSYNQLSFHLAIKESEILLLHLSSTQESKQENDYTQIFEHCALKFDGLARNEWFNRHFVK